MTRDFLSESASLKDDPLPVQITEQDVNLPSNIHMLDKEIEILKNHLKKLEENRASLVARAIETQIFEDQHCMIVRKTQQSLDVEMLKKKHPDIYLRAYDIKKHEMEESLKDIDKNINLTLVKAITKKIDSDCIKEGRESYVVLQKVKG